MQLSIALDQTQFMKRQISGQCFYSILLLISISTHAQKKLRIAAFASQLDSIRIALKIPAMALAVMQNDIPMYEAGLGYSDVTRHDTVTMKTCFRIASITKTFTSTLVMQLVEKGKLNLDSPISNFGIDLGDPHITVRNLITHSSEIVPGKYFQYNGYRYGKLGQVIEKVTGIPFYQALMENIIQPLGMTFSAPGLPIHDSLFDFYSYTRTHPEMISFFHNSFAHLSKAYDVSDKGEVVETRYLEEFGAFGGLASNIHDLLKYSEAIDSNRLVSAKTQREIFTPNRLSDGELSPYGLGWFVQRYRGIDYDWHYGQTLGESGLLVKVPGEHLTLLANSDKLSQLFPLGDGDLFMSPVGQLFYKYFINEDSGFEKIDYSWSSEQIRNKILLDGNRKYLDFYNREIIVHAAISNFDQDTIRARQLYRIYAGLNFAKMASTNQNIIVQIRDVGINKELAAGFTMKKRGQVSIYGVGENCSGDFSSWCDYGWIEDD